ncbi:hypothetical protein F5Y03DRAFT_392144 [Xylaria venustula]|nr:hypothetical protein F5Y03DRAFT_392144 [Xylaria venustula]
MARCDSLGRTADGLGCPANAGWTGPGKRNFASKGGKRNERLYGHTSSAVAYSVCSLTVVCVREKGLFVLGP